MTDEEQDETLNIVKNLERDMRKTPIRNNEDARAEAAAQLNNAINDFKKADDIYWDNQTTKNKEARHKARLVLSVARRRFRLADYEVLNAQRYLNQYDMEHNIKETKSVSEKTSEALIVLELTKEKCDKTHAEYKKALNGHPDFVQAEKEFAEAKRELDASKDKYNKAKKKMNEIEIRLKSEHKELNRAYSEAVCDLIDAISQIKNIEKEILGGKND